MANIKKRADGRYLIQVHIGWQPNGNKKYKNVYGKSIYEVQQKAAEVRKMRSSGTLNDDDKKTLEEWSEKWLTTYKSDVRPSTYKMYENAIRIHILPTLGKSKLKDIRNHHLQKLLSDMGGNNYKKRTVEITKQTINQIFRKAFQNGLILNNPADGLIAYGEKGEKRRALTYIEQEHFLKYCIHNKDGMFALFLYYFGLRRGEALALTKRDIDFSAGTLTVNKSIDFKVNPASVCSPKSSAGFRTIPIPEPFVTTLKNYIDSLDGLLLFTKRNGELVSLSSFRKSWKRFNDNLNKHMGGNENIRAFPEIQCHMLRHTYATMLYDLGVDVKTAQTWLGHSDPTITMQIYTHLSLEREQKSSDLLKNWGKLIRRSD